VAQCLPITASFSSPAAAQAPEAKDFHDDFAGTSLRPEWTIVNQDANRWALVDNDYLLLVLKDEKNKFCYKRAVPEQYEFLVKVVTQGLKSQVVPSGGVAMLGAPGVQLELFYVSIDNAKDEGLKVMTTASIFTNKETFIFGKKVGNDLAALLKEGDTSSEEDMEYYLRIVKSGIAYTAYISHDGISWTVGKHHFPGFSGSPCFGGLSSTGTEKTVKVDFAELKALR
jgi:hypothetical protein